MEMMFDNGVYQNEYEPQRKCPSRKLQGLSSSALSSLTPWSDYFTYFKEFTNILLIIQSRQDYCRAHSIRYQYDIWFFFSQYNTISIQYFGLKNDLFLKILLLDNLFWGDFLTTFFRHFLYELFLNKEGREFRVLNFQKCVFWPWNTTFQRKKKQKKSQFFSIDDTRYWRFDTR